ncbi:hypothetical protein BDV98DRAFT_256547 [Pterulicium gracile]|uniref:Uncharacterized protein n=1 Tax=Pterulicium gracile TaxID=1884261 RepID=A0A5C3QHF8_9AGAR|nr:hypothetical protein BDV98DRAFT_256547 [Pterula gracilis]
MSSPEPPGPPPSILQRFASLNFFASSSSSDPNTPHDHTNDPFLSPPTFPDELPPISFHLGAPEAESSAAASHNATTGNESAQGWMSPASLLSPLPFSPVSLARLQEQPDFDDDGGARSRDSIMLYSPAFPRGDSIVELARLEDIPGDTPAPPNTQVTTTDEALTPSLAQRPRSQNWVPSATDLSIQLLWWGYRLFLPPPLLAQLSERQIAASRRAAIITAALTWFLDNIPAELGVVLGASAPGVVGMLGTVRSLVPVVGYVGAAVGWGWSVIVGCDRGRTWGGVKRCVGVAVYLGAEDMASACGER